MSGHPAPPIPPPAPPPGSPPGAPRREIGHDGAGNYAPYGSGNPAVHTDFRPADLNMPPGFHARGVNASTGLPTNFPPGASALHDNQEPPPAPYPHPASQTVHLDPNLMQGSQSGAPAPYHHSASQNVDLNPNCMQGFQSGAPAQYHRPTSQTVELNLNSMQGFQSGAPTPAPAPYLYPASQTVHPDQNFTQGFQSRAPAFSYGSPGMFDRHPSQTVHLHAQGPAYQYPPQNASVLPAHMRPAPAGWQPSGVQGYPARGAPQSAQNYDHQSQYSVYHADNSGQENYATWNVPPNGPQFAQFGNPHVSRNINDGVSEPAVSNRFRPVQQNHEYPLHVSQANSQAYFGGEPPRSHFDNRGNVGQTDAPEHPPPLTDNQVGHLLKR
jgi:hypothetical protein